jgi:hypothetical protein
VAGGMPEAEAAVRAGYSETAIKQLVYRFRRDDRIQKRIAKLKEGGIRSKIKTPEELKEFWSTNIDDPGISMVTRTEQSKLLARALNMFVDNKKIEADVNHKAVMVMPEVRSNEDWDRFWEEKNDA